MSSLLEKLSFQAPLHLQTLIEVIRNYFRSLFQNEREGMWEAVGSFLIGSVRIVCVHVLWLCNTNLMLKRIPKVSVNMVAKGEVGGVGTGRKKRSALLEFRLKGCCRVLQAEVCEPRVALTWRLYGTVAVMSSVMSHSGPLVGEHQLLGIQMWLMYRLSYSLAKERRAQCHNSPFSPCSVMLQVTASFTYFLQSAK